MSDTSPPDELDELDELAAALGRHAREREQAELEARPSEWEAALRGELDFDDALEARRAAGEQAEPELERAAAYFRPFDGDETTSLVDGLLANLAEQDTDTEAGESEAGESEAKDDSVVPFARPEPKPTHDPGSSRSWIIPGGMLVAAAAAIVVWWVWPPSADIQDFNNGGDDGPKLASREPLPAYVLETDGGLKQLRGDTEGVAPEAEPRHRYRRDTPFEWILRPKVDLNEAIAVRGFVFADGGSAGLPLALEPLIEIADSGAIRITGKIAQLDLEPGRYTIALAVGRPDELPTQAAQLAPDAAAEQGSPEAPWAVRRIDIVIEDEGAGAPSP